MKANITGHKEVLQAGDMLLQKGGVGLKFLHHNRKNSPVKQLIKSVNELLIGSEQNQLVQCSTYTVSH